MTIAVMRTLQEQETPATLSDGIDIAITSLTEFSRITPGLLALALLLTYLVSAIVGLMTGAFQAGYNLMEHLLGQKAMVEKASEEGRAIGIA